MNTLKQTLTMILFAVCVTSALGQTIRRVNNTGIPLGPNMYPQLQEAHNAANNGDIIYIEGSGTAYQNLICSKRLTIIGPGYYLGENYANFSDLRAVDLGTVTFDPGSQGSFIIGCTSASINIKTSNIVIERNAEIYVYTNPTTSINGVVITKNYDVNLSTGTSQNVNALITNNYITYCNLGYDNHSGTASNNIISGNFYLNNFNVTNNIQLSSSIDLVNCAMNNNLDARALTGSSGFGTANGNQANVDKTKLFVGATGNSTDGQWKLKTGSLAIGAGFNGVDCGIYSGTTPYELSGVSSLDYPAITSFTTSGSGSNTVPLSVTISTKSN